MATAGGATERRFHCGLSGAPRLCQARQRAWHTFGYFRLKAERSPGTPLALLNEVR